MPPNFALFYRDAAIAVVAVTGRAGQGDDAIRAVHGER